MFRSSQLLESTSKALTSIPAPPPKAAAALLSKLGCSTGVPVEVPPPDPGVNLDAKFEIELPTLFAKFCISLSTISETGSA